MAALDQEQIRAIDQIRQRLQTLSTSVGTLRSEIASSQQPMPSWSSVQTHSNLISNNVQAIASQLAEHQHLLSSTTVFPLPQFPGRFHANIIETFLRTKLEPNVEQWAEKASHQPSNSVQGDRIDQADLQQLWDWAPRAANIEARQQTWGADYTLAEKKAGVENVTTGLIRALEIPPDPALDEDEEEGSEYDYEEVEEDVGEQMDVEPSKPSAAQGVHIDQEKPRQPPMSLEVLHKFMTTAGAG